MMERGHCETLIACHIGNMHQVTFSSYDVAKSQRCGPMRSLKTRRVHSYLFSFGKLLNIQHFLLGSSCLKYELCFYAPNYCQ